MKCSIVITDRGNELSLFYKKNMDEIITKGEYGLVIDVAKNMENQKGWLEENESLSASLEILKAKQQLKLRRLADTQLEAEGLISSRGTKSLLTPDWSN